MDFDWTHPPFASGNSISLSDIEESFEDPFAIKLMPDSPRFSVQARFFNLGVSVAGSGVFSIYRTNGKLIRVIHARAFEPEEFFFYNRKVSQALSQVS